MTHPRSRCTGRDVMTPGTAGEPRSTTPGPHVGQVPRVILVRGPIREPLDRRANGLIASGVTTAAMAVSAVLIVALALPGPWPLSWLVWTVVVGCLAMAGVSIAVGVAVRVGLAHARQVRRRQPPTPSPRRTHVPVVIDGSLVDPGPPLAPRPATDGR